MFEQSIFSGPGTGTFTTHTLELLIMMIVPFIMGLWMGWATWSRFRQISDRLRTDNESLTLTVNNLRAEIDALRGKAAASDTEHAELNAHLEALDRENATLRSRLSRLEGSASEVQDRNRRLETELGLSHAPDAAPDEQQDEVPTDIPLEINTGEPEYDAETWAPDPEAELAGMSVEEATAASELVEEFGDAQPAFILEEPSAPPVPEPAPFVTPPDDAETVAPAAEEPSVVVAEEAQPPLVVVMPPGRRDDLKIVEGIGPKIEELLFQNDIHTYQQLAETPVEELRNILATAGSRFAMHDPGTWSAQALLAANGEWDNLKAYQDFLNAGKRPQ